jgi:hypothetical protein
MISSAIDIPGRSEWLRADFRKDHGALTPVLEGAGLRRSAVPAVPDVPCVPNMAIGAKSGGRCFGEARAIRREMWSRWQRNAAALGAASLQKECGHAVIQRDLVMRYTSKSSWWAMPEEHWEYRCFSFVKNRRTGVFVTKQACRQHRTVLRVQWPYGM